MKHIFCLLAALFLAVAAQPVQAQARLMLNGATMVLSNGAKLVIENPQPNAISADSGSILTMSANDQIIWKIGTTAGTYTFPFASPTAEPVVVTFTKTAGAGEGYYRLSSFALPTWENSRYLPEGVSHLSDSNGIDLSEQVADRFWEVSPIGYTENPELTSLIFTYTEDDYLATGNSITEQDLKPLQWNSDAQDWRDFSGNSTLNTTDNTVTITSLKADQQFNYWMLSGTSAMVLPVHFIHFTAQANGSQTDLFWETATEENNEYFVVERSANGSSFEAVVRVAGSGTTHSRKAYTATDLHPYHGVSYYRIKQVDSDGKASYSPTRSVFFAATEALVHVYPNPATTYQMVQLLNWQNQSVTVQLTDLQGRVLLSLQAQINNETSKTLQLDFPALPSGSYFLTITGAEKTITQKLLIGK